MDILALGRLGRFKDIITVLARHGFDDIAQRLQFPGRPFFGKTPAQQPKSTAWKRLRRTIEDLGPTFVKFGQILSLRVDLLPLELILELERLQDSVEPVPFELLRDKVEDTLEHTIAEVFAEFEEAPLAAGSLAQVHRAVLRKGGAKVAVKVRRPGIIKVVNSDLEILEGIAAYLNDHLEIARTYDFVNLVAELKRALLRELNFLREAQNMRVIGRNFAGDSRVFIPRAHEEYCAENLLVMDLAEGVKLKELSPDAMARREELARRGVSVIVKQILVDGFFHADPHPGNFLILPDDRLCLLDWGVVGIVAPEARHDLVDLLDAVVNQDSERLVDLFESYATDTAVLISERRLQRDVQEMLYSYHSIPLNEIRFNHLLADVNTLLRNHSLRVPSELLLMFKALVTAEGTARKLYPELNVVEEVRPHVTRMLLERWRPGEVWRKIRHGIYHVALLARYLPKGVHRILEKVERGELHIRLRHDNLGMLRRTIENASNRLTISVIISSIIVGSSMIITTGVKPLLFGYPAIGLVGYLFSALLGLVLVVGIMRNKKY